ncbi:MAG: trypsin-like peptidase domain-containing protein [Beijerinckiaceae bacterium]|nr:trypsin-like peptidase domain-containing protein [Beijerinckiaceae bacterium]
MGRFGGWIVTGALLLLALFVAEPYVARIMYSATQPRQIAPSAGLGAGEQHTIDLFRNTSPSVVHVFAQPRVSRLRQRFGDEGEDEQQRQSGTGFVWDNAGHIVTNNHVVSGAASYQVRLANGENVSATLVGRAAAYDLAVLRLGRVSAPPPPLAVGSSADLKVGQAVFAIGNPFGLDQTLTTGVISALQRRLPTEDGGELADVIQTDAAINPGNSGGPLLDSSGRLIGVNTAIYSPSGASAGIGFAIPVDVVNRVVPQLIRSGSVPTPGVGVLVGNEGVTAQLGINGLVVMSTVEGSPAARAGLRGVDTRTGTLGDVIVSANGKPVRRLADLARVMQDAGVGKTVRLGVLRGSRTFEVDVEVVDIRER